MATIVIELFKFVYEFICLKYSIKLKMQILYLSAMSIKSVDILRWVRKLIF